jgi:hypothetical protein
MLLHTEKRAKTRVKSNPNPIISRQNKSTEVPVAQKRKGFRAGDRQSGKFCHDFYA